VSTDDHQAAHDAEGERRARIPRHPRGHALKASMDQHGQIEARDEPPPVSTLLKRSHETSSTAATMYPVDPRSYGARAAE